MAKSIDGLYWQQDECCTISWQPTVADVRVEDDDEPEEAGVRKQRAADWQQHQT
jgi:hypothetical protein